MTGVNPVTLRAWERRYGLVVPQRTPSGHRLYSDRDVATIRATLDHMARGVPVSRARDSVHHADIGASPEGATGRDQWQEMIARAARAVERFDAPALDRVYEDALSLHPATQVTERLMLPLLWLLGDRWENRAAGIAEEHFFTTHLRNRLGARLLHRPLADGPVLVAACLPGERHEIGLLLFSMAASARGIRVVLLSADTPLRQVAETVRRITADGVVLSATCKPRRGLLGQPLQALARNLPVPVFVGGPVSVTRHDDLVAAGCEPVGENIPEAVVHVAQRLGA